MFFGTGNRLQPLVLLSKHYLTHFDHAHIGAWEFFEVNIQSFEVTPLRLMMALFLCFRDGESIASVTFTPQP